jgi:S-adenosylmethionine:tRNA ribosyltransferase-isomerase
MKLSDFDYHLPPELIAQHPAERRDESRLMLVDRRDQHIAHLPRFREILHLLHPGDLVVTNETRVLPARLLGRKERTGGAVEALVLHPIDADTWEAMVSPGRRVRVGTRIAFGDGALMAEVVDRTERGTRILRFEAQRPVTELIGDLGQVPLPPYIERDPIPADRERYQTVYARVPGAIAAPTAGLHFTEELLSDIRQKGVEICSIILHVGIGTFRPVRTESISEHRMEPEEYQISDAASRTITNAKREGRRVIAVGTTSVRALEAAATELGVTPGKGRTDLFIHPPYQFRVVDGLVTNFHLPHSTLLMLVSAFGGMGLIRKAYEEAVRLRYRFYSYGDAMLIV